jgi:hypothetical protein
MTTITLSTNQTEQRTTSVRFSAIPTAYASGAETRRRAPYFVPRNQAYFWTERWQADEADALREIAEGNVRDFASGAAAIAWLLSDDDDQ